MQPPSQTEWIAQRYQDVLEVIARAAQSAGRAAADARLVVVTKAHPLETALAVIAAGGRDLGENYPEETAAKIAQASPADLAGVTWHMIGHAQSRKAGLVAQHFGYMHSLDSLRLAQKLNARLADLGRTLPVLLEMNVAGEDSKGGWQASDSSQWAGLLPEIERIAALPHLRVQGLMTMPPLYDDPQAARPAFVRLVKLRDFLASRLPAVDWRELSMGTSGDYAIAVQEGATLVRVGSAIVGARPPKV